MDPQGHAGDDTVAEARRREIAIEHLLFGTIRHLAKHDGSLLDELESSLDHLWDRGHDGPRDDEAVRRVARTFLKSLRTDR